MTAQLLDGTSFAEAMKADLNAARRRRSIERGDRARARPRSSSATTEQRGVHPPQASRRPRRSASTSSAPASCPTDITQTDLLAAIASSTPIPRSTRSSCRYPTPTPLDYAAALTRGRPRQGRRRAAPDEPRPPRHGGRPGRSPCTAAGIEALLVHYGDPDLGTRGRDRRARAHDRPSARATCSSQKRPNANAAVTVVHTGVPDSAALHARGRHRVSAAGSPGIIQPEQVKPGAVVVSGGSTFTPGRTPAARRRRVGAPRSLVDHTAPRWRRPDHDRDVVAQHRRGRRTAGRSGTARSRDRSRRPGSGCLHALRRAARERRALLGVRAVAGGRSRAPRSRSPVPVRFALGAVLVAVYAVTLLVVLLARRAWPTGRVAADRLAVAVISPGGRRRTAP